MKKLILLLLFFPTVNFISKAQTSSKTLLAIEIEAFRNEAFIATEVFLNSQNDVSTRVAALTKYPFIYDQVQIQKVRELVLNNSINPLIRATGLSRLINVLPDDNELTNHVFKWVEDRTVAKELRSEALSALKTLSFSGFAMSSKNQQFLATARNLTSDPDIKFRAFAFDYLMAHGDSFAQGLLIKQLNAKRTDLLPTVDMLRLLSLNPHGDFLPTVFSVFKSPPNKESRIEAMSILGSYPPAKDMIVSILKNKKEANDTRAVALGILNSSYPDEFSTITQNILTDETESENLRVTAVYMEMFRRKSNQQRNKRTKPDAFDISVKKLAESGKTANIRKAGKSYIDNVNPKF